MSKKAAFDNLRFISNNLNKVQIDLQKKLEHFLVSVSFIISPQSHYTHFLVRDLVKIKEVISKYIHDVVTMAILTENQIDCFTTQNNKDFEGIYRSVSLEFGGFDVVNYL